MSDYAAVFEKLTAQQREVVGAIASAQDAGHSAEILLALKMLGLIERRGTKGWRLPEPVQAEWARWTA